MISKLRSNMFYSKKLSNYFTAQVKNNHLPYFLYHFLRYARLVCSLIRVLVLGLQQPLIIYDYKYIANFYHMIINSLNLKAWPSNNPLSLSFRDGMTNRAIKDKVINGAFKVQPNWSFTNKSILEYSSATS